MLRPQPVSTGTRPQSLIAEKLSGLFFSGPSVKLTDTVQTAPETPGSRRATVQCTAGKDTMRIPRIYEPAAPLAVDTEISLSEDGANHVGRVLRMETGEKIILFNGDGYDCEAQLTASDKKHVTALITARTEVKNESPLYLHLAQVISRGERMEFTLQKSVELGVAEITPLISSRCGVRLNAERMEKKEEQWRKIIISACEQCGRATVPKLNPTEDLEKFLLEKTEDLCLNLNPAAQDSIKNLQIGNRRVRLLIGSEGGLSDSEIALAAQSGYHDILLGPRVLRTETASLVAISIIQAFHGDLT